MEIDPKTGLPVEAIAWEDIAKSEQTIKVTTEKRRYGKVITVISGFDNGIDVKGTAKELKAKLACGGTVKGSTIELQGDHKKQVKPILVGLGFEADAIDDN